MAEWKVKIEQDGTRYRWEWWLDGRRLAKGARWWGTPAEAVEDYEMFAENVEDAPIIRPATEKDGGS